MQPIDWDAVAVCWLRMVCASSERHFGALRDEVERERQAAHCRRKPGRAPQHAQAYRGTLYRASKAGGHSTRFDEGEGQLDR